MSDAAKARPEAAIAQHLFFGLDTDRAIRALMAAIYMAARVDDAVTAP